MRDLPVTLEIVLAQELANQERELKKARLEELQKLCVEYDTLVAESRKKIWDLLKIPVTPAAMIAGTAATLAKFGFIEKEWGVAAVIADVTWAFWKFISSINKRNVSLEKAENVVSEVRLLLSKVDERDVLIARSLLDNSAEGLSSEVARGQKIEYIN